MSSAFDMSGSTYKFAISALQDYNSGNNSIVMSPVAIQIILALADMGAGGQTAQTLEVGLNLSPLNQNQIKNNIISLIKFLNQVDKKTTLYLANQIYINDTFQISSAFQSVATQFLAGIQSINFVDSLNATNEIDNWVSQKTHGNIVVIADANDFNAQTSMVFLNAIYFKGYWSLQFNPNQTRLSTFYATPNTTQQIEFMNINSDLNYGYNYFIDAQIFQMQYSARGLSMVFILPSDRFGLVNVISKLEQTNVIDILDPTFFQTIVASIPKFIIKSSINLTDTVTKLGMGNIFSPQANFSGMVTQVPKGDPLNVSVFTQRAYITIDEQGSATSPYFAAVTNNPFSHSSLSPLTSSSVVLPPLPPPPPPPMFIADHPFLFMVLQNFDVLMIGSFMGEPTKNNIPVKPIAAKCRPHTKK